MTREQYVATRNLINILNHCDSLGLMGGVFDGNFCVWPIESDSPHDWQSMGGVDFFDAVEVISHGEVIAGVKMGLDGGAGN